MKMKRIVCLALLCLLLVGCAAKTGYTGDMENALQALKWEDYESAYGEASAFLDRVPHSSTAQLVRETAAWRILGLRLDEKIELSEGKLVIENFGFSVLDLPKDPEADFWLKGYTVSVTVDRTFMEQDFKVASVTLREITLYWEYAGDDHGELQYTIHAPEAIQKSDIGAYLLNTNYFGDELSAEDHKEFVKYLQSAFVPSLNEVFKKIKKDHGFTPVCLGFEKWDQ